MRSQLTFKQVFSLRRGVVSDCRVRSARRELGALLVPGARPGRTIVALALLLIFGSGRAIAQSTPTPMPTPVGAGIGAAPDAEDSIPMDLDSPFMGSFAITPSDAAPLPYLTRGIYVGGTGDVTVYLKWDSGNNGPVTFPAVPAGKILWVRARAVLYSGTNATYLVGLY